MNTIKLASQNLIPRGDLFSFFRDAGIIVPNKNTQSEKNVRFKFCGLNTYIYYITTITSK